MKDRLTLLVGVCCLMWLLSVPGAVEAADVLRIGIDASGPVTFDPHFAAATQDRMLMDMVFNGLLRYQPGNVSTIEPDLAESIPKAKLIDGKQYWTFVLRKGVKFHQGPKTEAYELTAEDVLFSLQKAADPSRSAYAAAYTGMTFEKVDDYTIRIVVEKPLSSTLFLPRFTNCAGGSIISKKALEAMGDEGYKQWPVGTGPFLFNAYSAGKKVSLSAHTQYFRGAPLLEGIEIHYLPDIKPRERGLKTGALDVISGLQTVDWMRKVGRWEDTKLDTFGPGGNLTIFFNTTYSPLDDSKVRKAIAYALNRDDFCTLSDNKICEPALSPIPAFLPGGLTEKEVKNLGLDYSFDLDKARQLLREAGYPKGFSLRIVSSKQFDYLKNYEAIKRQIRRIGIDLKIKIVDQAHMHPQDTNPLVIYDAQCPDADVYLTQFFSSDAPVAAGKKTGMNFSHYTKLDTLIGAARMETNDNKQIELWRHAQIKILNDMAAYPSANAKFLYARKISVDYGHELLSSFAGYPQFTEKTRVVK